MDKITANIFCVTVTLFLDAIASLEVGMSVTDVFQNCEIYGLLNLGTLENFKTLEL